VVEEDYVSNLLSKIVELKAAMAIISKGAVASPKGTSIEKCL